VRHPRRQRPLVSFWRIVHLSFRWWTGPRSPAWCGQRNSEREDQDYVARRQGERGKRALQHFHCHVLSKRVDAPVIVSRTLTVGRVILLEST